MRSCTLLPTLLVVVLLALASCAVAKPVSFVLTGNPGADEAGGFGCSYTADPAYSNPPDPNGGRLLDFDSPGDWTTVAGINYVDQTVTFDLKQQCRIDGVAMLFSNGNAPLYVDVSVSANKSGPWTAIGKIDTKEKPDVWLRLDTPKSRGRYVKLFHKLNSWGWYLREVKIYGDYQTPAAGTLRRAKGSLFVTDKTRIYGTIVVADSPSRNALQAATDLRKVTRQMTGLLLPISKESDFKGKSAVILVGASKWAKRLGIDVKQDEDSGDRYVMRSFDKGIALVGNDDGVRRGSLYAVYDLLQKWGCGWYGPDPEWQIVPKVSRLAVGKLNVDERPAFDSRVMPYVPTLQMQYAWGLGGKSIACGHALGGLIPRDKYEKDHPEYFGSEQPCLTNPDVIKIAVDTFRKELDADKSKRVMSFSLTPNDTGGFCECANCQAAGNLGARMLRFANAIARELAKTHPKRYILCYLSYWYTHEAPSPMVKAEPGVCIMQVNEGSHVRAWDEPETELQLASGRSNARELAVFKGLEKTGAPLGIYEWWIPGCNDPDWQKIPWYSGDTALRNLRYWKRGGVKYIYYENGYESNPYPLRWPLYYIGSRGMWNPNTSAEKLMSEACKKLYGKAAKPMLNYYRTIEKAMSASPLMGGNWALPGAEGIYTPEIEAKATAYLDNAAFATTEIDQLRRITEEREMWDKARAVITKRRSGH